MSVRVRPGPVGTPLSRWRARRLQELRRDELALVRRTSEQWRTGLAAYLLLILTTSLTSGKDVVAERSVLPKILIGVFLLVAVLVAAAGIMFGNCAANGTLTRTSEAPSAVDLMVHDRLLAQTAMRNLRRSMTSAAVSCSALLIGIGLLWYA